uniref:BRX domain-containing protein n=1 Tax=Leersia perrieri TaxID=77586 RepID=A0A0D9XXM6_9ORYZ
MHVCFHGGGGGDGRAGATIAKSIVEFTKILIGRGAPRRRCKDAAATAAAAASAKIAPAQMQEEEDQDGKSNTPKRQEFCDKCCSSLPEAATAAEEWEAEPEPGVVLTLAARRDGVGNRLRRIRFSEEAFDPSAAQCWWARNHHRIAELYTLVADDSDDTSDDAMLPATPCQSEAEEEEEEESSRSPSTSNSTFSGGGESAGTVGSPILGLVTDASVAGDRNPSPAAAEAWREWVEEYEPGVFITVRAYTGHRLELRCVELSRERFGEVKARVWWEENKARLHHLYSF